MRTTDDLTMKAITIYASMSKTMHESALVHGLVILAEGTEHKCKSSEELIAGAAPFPEFDDDQIRAFFAYERAVLEMFKITRRGLEAAGLPVETGDRT